VIGSPIPGEGVCSVSGSAGLDLSKGSLRDLSRIARFIPYKVADPRTALSLRLRRYPALTLNPVAENQPHQRASRPLILTRRFVKRCTQFIRNPNCEKTQFRWLHHAHSVARISTHSKYRDVLQRNTRPCDGTATAALNRALIGDRISFDRSSPESATLG